MKYASFCEVEAIGGCVAQVTSIAHEALSTSKKVLSLAIKLASKVMSKSVCYVNHSCCHLIKTRIK